MTFVAAAVWAVGLGLDIYYMVTEAHRALIAAVILMLVGAFSFFDQRQKWKDGNHV